MIFSQPGSYFGRPGRQGVDGNLTGNFHWRSPACWELEEEYAASSLYVSRSRELACEGVFGREFASEQGPLPGLVVRKKSRLHSRLTKRRDVFVYGYSSQHHAYFSLLIHST
jgi:hypothetical protein